MNPNNIVNKEVYEGVSLALSKFSDEFPNNTASLRVDAVFGGTIVTTEASVGLNGVAAPTSSTQVGGTNGTNLIPIKVDSDGTINENLTKVGGSAISLGQKTSSVSLPVVIASDQSAIPVTFTPSGTQNVNISQVAGVTISQGHGTAASAIRVELPTDGTGVVGLNTGVNIIGKVGIDQTTPGTTNLVSSAQSGTWNITNISGTISLPTGASTSALQTTGNTTLTSISGKLPSSLGPKVSTLSLSVTSASDGNFPISVSGGGSGQQPMAGSLPVVIASDQSPVSVTITPGTTTVILSQFRSLITSNTSQTIKGSPGNLYRFNITNTAATIIYVKLYNIATPTSSSTPVYVIAIPSGIGSTESDEFIIPENFDTAIGIRCVTGIADNDTTSPLSSPIVEIRYL